MNTAALNPVVGRFVWKEYRMLRGFWLAVAVLTVIEQWLSTLLAPPGSNVPAWLFGSAWFAAALYAVGAAATSFAVEHEEETYGFLSGLPTTWPALLIGKLIVSIGSALALAAVLSLTGWALGGPIWWQSDARLLVGLFGMAIFEATAWGMLFSLLLKRPLVAAICTLIVATLAIHVAVNAASDSFTASLQLRAYSRAIPLRLAITAGALLLCVLQARQWLAVGTGSAGRRFAAIASSIAPVSAITRLRNCIASGTRPSRSRMFARLLWQTWRESWKLLPVPLLFTGFLLFVIAILGSTAHFNRDDFPLFLVASSVVVGCYLPALYGALAFHADQRRRQYRFLAEHAAGPGWVWLARQVVWLGALVALSLAISLVASAVTALSVQRDLHQYFSWQQRYWMSPQVALYNVQLVSYYALFGAASIGFGAFVAYGLGQLCSMLLRSSIIAAFLAMVLAIVVAAWTAVVLLWGLNGWLFLMPLAVGLLAATWLRAPDWLAERSSWQHWGKPAVALLVPIVLIGFMLPSARLAQLPANEHVDAFQSMDAPAKEFDPQDFTAAELETAEQLYQALCIRHTWIDKGIRYEGPRPAEEEERYDQAWEALRAVRERSKEKALALLAEANRRFFAHLDAQARKTAEMYLRAAEQRDDLGEMDLELLLSATRRPTCRFDFDWSLLEVPNQDIDSHFEDGVGTWLGIDDKYVTLTRLAQKLPSLAPSGSEVEYYIAALRMCGHLRQHVPTSVFICQLRAEQAILKSFAHWAQEDSRTDEQLRDALEKLQEYFRSDRLAVWDSLEVDQQLLRDVIEGKQWPLALTTTPMRPEVYLAYLANRLPWERQRALRSLDFITAQNADDAASLQDALDEVADLGHNTKLRQWLRPSRYSSWLNPWLVRQPTAATSYLMRYEYEARVPIPALFFELADTETYRRATLLVIALARYHLEHQNYPATLAKLAPDYVDQLPMDPYSGRPFEYRPAGLDLQLQTYYPSYLQIAAHTPLFWSAGPSELLLTRQVFTSGQSSEKDSDGEPVELRETMYAFSSQYAPWGDCPVLVFPLPK